MSQPPEGRWWQSDGPTGRTLLSMGPHGGAHRVALRAGISVLVPLLVLVVLGHVEWTPYAAFGAFTSLYGRRQRHADPVGALLAAWGSLTSDAYRWHPPGPVFLVFGLAVCAMIPATPADLLVAPAIAGASAAFSLLVGHIGVLRDPGAWSMPTLPRPAFREALRPVGARAHLLRYLVALTNSGAVATALGWAHPYWAMVASVVVLSGPDLSSRLTRGVHRVVGTLLGVGVAAAILPWAPRGVGAVLIIVALQGLAELFVGRNYAFALLFITPLALMMGQLVHPSPVAGLLRDRLFETVLGAVVAAAVLAVVPDSLSGRRGSASPPGSAS